LEKFYNYFPQSSIEEIDIADCCRAGGSVKSQP
jgi:hypothetical protein